MKIPLKEFEQHIDTTIFKRGFQYFKKGYITNVDELSGGEYEATVEGTETYTVNLTVKNDVMTESVCTCPYDMGAICKHVVAVMFYLQKDILDLKPTKARKPTDKTKPTKKKTIEQQVDEILDKLSNLELSDYIRESCKNDRVYRQLFLSKYAHITTPVSKELYVKQIAPLAKSLTGRDGWMSFDKVRLLGNTIYAIVQNAEKEVANGNYQAAMYMSQAVIEQSTIIMQDVDDSNGDIGGNIEPAVEVFVSLTKAPLDEVLRIEMFNYVIECYQKGLFEGWGWHWNMVHIAIGLIKTTHEKVVVSTILKKIKPNGKDWDWDYMQAQQLTLELILKTDTEAAALKYMEDNISNSKFREKIIEKAIADKNYNKAIELAKQGAIGDKKDKPGLASQWGDYLLAIYQLTKDSKNIIAVAREFIIEQRYIGRSHPLKYYYSLLKKNVSVKEWDTFFEQLIVDMGKASKWGVDFSMVSSLYVLDEKWEQLFELLKKHISLRNIESVEKFLASKYSDELTDLYINAIAEFLKKNDGRGNYQEACRYIRRIIKLGARSKADQLIANLRTTYPRRPALIEELSRV